MKLIALALTLIAVALVGGACTETVSPTNSPAGTAPAAPPSPTTPPDPLAAARTNYAKHCEPCHGPEGVGGLVKVEDKQIKVASLKSPGVIKHTDEELAKVITSGEEAMPAFKDKLSQPEIQDLVRFVRKEFQGK